jgi:hypothetical protein
MTGLANANVRWCNVNYLTFGSTAAKDIHVLGDSIQIAPGMPKSGHMANSQAVAAGLVSVVLAQGWWHAHAHASVRLHVREHAGRTPNRLRADVIEGRVEHRDAAGRVIAVARAAAGQQCARRRYCPMIAAVATISSNRAIETLPLTA